MSDCSVSERNLCLDISTPKTLELSLWYEMPKRAPPGEGFPLDKGEGGLTAIK